jgi:hypothetical protein
MLFLQRHGQKNTAYLWDTDCLKLEQTPNFGCCQPSNFRLPKLLAEAADIEQSKDDANLFYGTFW